MPPQHVSPAKFIQGTIGGIDCSNAPSALVTVLAGAKTLKVTINDINHVVLIGADKFSCSWLKRRVAVNYREVESGENTAVSFELQ